jgi:hypothetical protein
VVKDGIREKVIGDARVIKLPVMENADGFMSAIRGGARIGKSL